MAQFSETAGLKPKLAWVIPGLVLISLALGYFVAPHERVRIWGGVGQSVDSFDFSILSFLNRFARRSWALDTYFYVIDSNPLATAPIFMAYWWAWFKKGEDQSRNRELLLNGIVLSFFILVVVRVVALALPLRTRPLHNPALHFQLPYNMDPSRLIEWSSFPSDHAILWFLLVTTLLFVSRRVGIFLYVYVSLTLCIARVYMGAHYPTDILAGALIGVTMASLSKVPGFLRAVTYQPLRWLDRSPGSFYAFFFIITEQLMGDFSSFRELETFSRAILKGTLKLL